MKKSFLTLIAAALCAVGAFAYNPPLQGENFFYLSHPEMLTGGNSTAGGGILSVIPASGTLNPALIGMEERVTLDLGYTAMLNCKPKDGFTGELTINGQRYWANNYGASKLLYSQAFGTGIIIPTDWANFGGELEFILDEKCMGLGNSFNLKAFASKQVIEKLFIGVGLDFGYEWNLQKDWMLTADVGAVYNFGDLGFLHNFRVAASALNMGKTYGTSWDWMGYPAMFTVKAGAAAELLHTDKFVLGLSLDVTTPLFVNCIFDSGLQFRICDFVQINTSWQFNMKEFFDGNNSWLPTLGVVFKIPIGMGKSEFVKKNDWSKSELCPSLGWKNVNWDINLISAGAVLRLGELDDSGPDIEIE